MSSSEGDFTQQDRDGPPDELEPGEVVKAELGRLIHHPRAEAARLREVAAEGEQGSTPFILLAQVAVRVVPLVAILVGVMLLIYFKA
jgi:hypothetical protein